jgi:hypothetical protein
LIGGDGKLAVDAGDVLLVGHQQPGQIFGEMLPFGFVLEQWTELNQGFLISIFQFCKSSVKMLLQN